MATSMPPIAQFSLPKAGGTPVAPAQSPNPTQGGIPPVAQFSLPKQSSSLASVTNSKATPGNPTGSPSGFGSLATLGKNLASVPGQLASAGASLLPAIPDIYHDIKGDSTKTALQQAGDVGTTALSVGSLIPGVDLLDVGLLGAKTAGKAALKEAPSFAAKLTRGGLIGGGYGASGALGAGETDPTKIGLSTAEGAAGGVVGEGLLSKLIPPTEQQRLKKAIEGATPSYNPKLIGNGEVAANGRPRVEEGNGILGKRKVNPTAREIAAGTESTKISNFPTSGTALERYNAVEPAIAQKGQNLMESLKNENVLRPPKEIKSIVQKAVNTAAENSVLLQKADPAVTNYLRVAGRAIDQSPGTLAGEMQVRQALDNAYEDAGGKYGNNKALDQIHRAARNALNDDMESKATNTAVKQSLREQSNLYNLQDILQDEARTEGGTSLERTMKKYPNATKAAKTGLGFTGLGQVMHLIP